MSEPSTPNLGEMRAARSIFAVVLCILVFWLISGSPLVAQELPWDPMPDSEAILQGRSVPEEEAVVLFKKTHIRVYGQTSFFITKRIEYVRILLLGEKGLAYADMEIPYRKGERIVDLAARTVTPSGEVVPVLEGQIFDKTVLKVGRNMEQRVKAFAFPRAEKGSIIEYQVAINRDGFLWIDPHVFDDALPVLSSSLEFVANREILYGYATQAAPGLSLTPEFSKSPTDVIMRWDLQNLPPLPNEELQPPLSFLANRIVLKPVYWRGEPILESWDEVAEVYTEVVVRPFLRKDSKLKRLVKERTKGLNQEQVVNHLYSYVLETIHPLETYGIVPSAMADELIELGRGDITDRNLLLVALLRAAKVKAFPALAATREYSSLSEQFPGFSEFDRVICGVEIGDDLHFLDAARPEIAPGSLPSETEGIRVVVVRKNKAEIVPTPSYAIDKNRTVVNTEITWMTADPSEGSGDSEEHSPEMVVKIQIMFHGHEAEPVRSVIRNDAAEEGIDIEQVVHRRFSELEISAIEVDKLKPLDPIQLRVNLKARPTRAANRLLIQLPTWTGLEKSPLTTSRRGTPVMFDYPYELSEKGTMAIPEDYTIEEMPPSVSLENPHAEFQFSIRQIGATIEWQRRFTLKSTFCPPSEYSKLRELLSEVVKWDTSPVVLCLQ